MTLIEPLPARKLRKSVKRVIPDRRRYKRISTNLLGRFMCSDKKEHPCRVTDISVGGASIEAAHVVAEDEHIVVYFDEIGRLEGPVVRRFESGFAMEIRATQHKREKLAATLTWLANRNILNLDEERRYGRVVPDQQRSVLCLEDGSTYQCEVQDVSVGGASVGIGQRPPIGTPVSLGRLRARVVRHHESGVGLEFVDIQNPKALRRHFG